MNILKKYAKKIVTSLLTLSMALGMVSLTPVLAANDTLTFNENHTYAIVSDEKAMNFKAVGWQTPTTVDGSYIANGNKVSSQSLLKITPMDDQSGLSDKEVRIKMEYVGIENEIYPVRSEGGNTFVFADADKREDACTYVIQKTGTNTGIIQDETRDYYFSIGSNNEIVRVQDINEATTFTFIENPTVVDFTYYIEHKATGKYVKVNGANQAVTVDSEVINDDARWNASWGEYNGRSVTFISKSNSSLSWQGGNVDEVKTISRGNWGGWESIRVVPCGNGTVSFKDTADGKFFTVQDHKIVKTNNTTQSDENGEFIIHSLTAPESATDVVVSEIDDTAITVSWNAPIDTFYTGFKVVATPSVESGKAVLTSNETAQTTMRLEGLEVGTEYEITILTVNADDLYSETAAQVIQTKNGPRPVQVTQLTASEVTQGIKVEWEAVKEATSYDVYRAVSAFGEYTKIATVDTNCYIDDHINDGKYNNYYKIVAMNENGESDLSDQYTSLETELFGRNMYIFAETDDFNQINEITKEIFKRQNSYTNNAQFNENRYAIYFKPGNYVGLDCISVGFYTHIGGLGKTPYDVKLNNIEVPAYLDGSPTAPSSGHPFWEDNGAAGIWRNATCNFWRSAENLSVVGTGEATNVPGIIEDNGTQAGLSNWKADYFNWSVAQAAPLRRVYSTRNVSYDVSYGWASGGYTADCYFTGKAGTDSGQQYFTRNSVIEGDAATGTTLNNFHMGVISKSLDEAATTPLLNGNGYSNWSQGNIGDTQGVLTHITSTPKISEKPFLFLDDQGEYKIFVPAVRENATGVSWGNGQANDGMGEGKIMSLDDFYIAKEGDNAATINEQLEAGQNIFFTPGVYHAEEIIQVNRANTIVLGTGMASLIPDNSEAAMEVADEDGIIVAGLIFDAGASSRYLLKVGTQGQHQDHANAPIVLHDIFFRVGGTTSSLTKADIALEINSDDVICDHFWIWRADHGAGVAWDGNVSTNGLIVNGDDVTCYALFNEHFEEYDTLWNGNHGATYFYQNEKCYDPISQEAWMSHNHTTNGYAAYKVSNNVTDHYAVGLGIYNVFIYTGPTYDASQVQIQLDNAIEVPNQDNVIVENACIQTFAKEDGVLQKFNSIINGVGNGVSSGTDLQTGEVGDGWSRQFLMSYCNGIAVVGNQPEDDQKGKYVGTTVINDVKALGDDHLDLTSLKASVDTALTLDESQYTPLSFADLKEALHVANQACNNEDNYLKYATQNDINELNDNLNLAMNNLKLLADKTELKELYDAQDDRDYQNYTVASWDTFEKAMIATELVLNNVNVSQETVQLTYTALDSAIKGLVNIQALNDLYVEKSNINKDLYTPHSVENLETALANAKTVLEKSDASQDEVDQAYQMLDTVVLQERANTMDLQKLYDAQGDKNSQDYTAESWETFEKAMNTAHTVLTDDNATQIDVDNAYIALDQALQGLKKVTPVVPGNQTDPVTPDQPNTGDQTHPATPNQPNTGDQTTPATPNQSNHVDQNVATQDASMITPYVILATCALGVLISIKKRKENV